MTTPRLLGLRPQAPRRGAGRPPGPTPPRTVRLTLSLHPEELDAIEGQREEGETTARAARRLALRMSTHRGDGNMQVRVRLTDAGRACIRKNYDRLAAKAEPFEMPPFRATKEDAEGWSTWTLWELMQELGPHQRNGGQHSFSGFEIVESKKP